MLDEMNSNEKVIQGICLILQTLNSEEQAETLEKLVQHCINEYITLFFYCICIFSGKYAIDIYTRYLSKID